MAQTVQTGSFPLKFSKRFMPKASLHDTSLIPGSGNGISMEESLQKPSENLKMRNIDVIPGEICGGMPGTIPKEIILENFRTKPYRNS